MLLFPFLQYVYHSSLKLLLKKELPRLHDPEVNTYHTQNSAGEEKVVGHETLAVFSLTPMLYAHHK